MMKTFAIAFSLLLMIQFNVLSPHRAVADDPLPFVPGSWTMAVIPDTQNMIKASASQAEIVTQMTQWIVENRDARNIQFVMHEGDVVNDNNTIQWDRAKASISILDGQIPYAITVGNHDAGPGGSGRSRDSLFNDPGYFGVGSPYANQKTIQGFFEPEKTDNTYHVFNANGQDFLVVATEWAPRDEVLSWAGDIIAAHSLHRTIFLTHAYLGDEDNGRYDWDARADEQHWSPRDPSIYGADVTNTANDGEDIWNELVRRHTNIDMVIAGHSSTSTGGNYLLSQGDHGNGVHQIVFNAQGESRGGNGWLRLIEFLPNNTSVQVKTYSPFLDEWRTDSTNQFAVELSPVPEPHAAVLALIGGLLICIIRTNRRCPRHV